MIDGPPQMSDMGKETELVVPRKTKYIPTEKEKAEVERNFTYHPPKEDQPNRYIDMRFMFQNMALHIFEECPPSRERSLALTKLEESVMWANAAIARNE